MQIQIGDKVAYSAKFLRSTGQTIGDCPRARGIVTAIRTYGSKTSPTVIAEVNWDNPELVHHINTYNLARVGTPAMNSN